MANEDMISTFAACSMRTPATEEAIARLEQWAGKRLPDDYLALMRYSNGLEGFVAEEAYLVLYGVEEIPKLNELSGVNEFAPGLLLIGSDGGGEAYAFDTRREPMPVQEVSFVGMSHEEARTLGATFTEFLNYLRQQRS